MCSFHSSILLEVYLHSEIKQGYFISKDSTLFSQILMLELLHPDQAKWEKSYQKLEQIMTEHMDSIDLKHIGFPVAWSQILR